MVTTLPPDELRTPASVFDIVTFGFRLAFYHWKPLTRLCLPFLLLLAGAQSWVQMQTALLEGGGRHAGLAASLALLFGSMGFLVLLVVLAYYFQYILLRYIRDLYRGQLKQRLFAYLIPDADILPLLGLSTLVLCLLIPVIPATLLGMVFLLVPGFCVLYWYAVFVILSYISLMERPQSGVMGALTQGWSLLKTAPFRSISLFLLVTCVLYVVAPFSLIELTRLLAQTGVRHAGFAPYAGVISFILCVLYQWCAVVVGYTAMIAAAYRFYFDLEARRADNAVAAAITPSDEDDDTHLSRILRQYR